MTCLGHSLVTTPLLLDIQHRPPFPHQERAPCQRAFGPILKPLSLDTIIQQHSKRKALPIGHTWVLLPIYIFIFKPQNPKEVDNTAIPILQVRTWRHRENEKQVQGPFIPVQLREF